MLRPMRNTSDLITKSLVWFCSDHNVFVQLIIYCIARMHAIVAFEHVPVDQTNFFDQLQGQSCNSSGVLTTPNFWRQHSSTQSYAEG